MMLCDFLSTTRPCCVTTCGSCGIACESLFCTLTWLMSGLVPGLNTTTTCALPLEELVE